MRVFKIELILLLPEQHFVSLIYLKIVFNGHFKAKSKIRPWDPGS